MNIRISQAQGRAPVTIFHLEGQFNLGSAEEFEQIAQAEHAHGMKNLLVDLAQVTSLTSAGLRSLHIVYKMLGTTGSGGAKASRLKLLNPAPEIRRVLAVAGYENFIEIFDTQEQAVAAFSE